MAPFESLYGRRCISPVGWYEAGEFVVIGPDIVNEALEKVRVIRYILKSAQIRQNFFADNERGTVNSK